MFNVVLSYEEPITGESVHMSRAFDDESLYDTLKMSYTWQYVFVEDKDERYLSDCENQL